ncbi:hypothetical protein ACP70R_021323 [Stipagrostis hirtigluma subsp. patula]
MKINDVPRLVEDELFIAAKNYVSTNMSKPRTALLQGREDDEPMIAHTISASKSENKCDCTYISEVPSACDAMSSKVVVGADLCKKENNRDRKSCIQIGSMLVTIEEAKEHIQVSRVFPRAWNNFLSSPTRPQVNQITESQDMEIPNLFGLGLVQPDRYGRKIL